MDVEDKIIEMCEDMDGKPYLTKIQKKIGKDVLSDGRKVYIILSVCDEEEYDG